MFYLSLNVLSTHHVWVVCYIFNCVDLEVGGYVGRARCQDPPDSFPVTLSLPILEPKGNPNGSPNGFKSLQNLLKFRSEFKLDF